MSPQGLNLLPWPYLSPLLDGWRTPWQAPNICQQATMRIHPNSCPLQRRLNGHITEDIFDAPTC